MSKESFTLSANGNTETFQAQGDVTLHGSGTFGSGTVTIEQELDGAFVTLSGFSHTAAFDEVLRVTDSGVYRLKLAGSTSPALKLIVSGPLA